MNFVACSRSDGVSEGVLEEMLTHYNIAGLPLLVAQGDSVILGSIDPNSKVNERPEMRAKFTYNFYMARHETTCGEYNRVIKRETGYVVECENESLPVTNVSYYDAVLYANALSKSEQSDTAYTYQSRTFDSENHCINLEGLVYHPEVEAYRLPTEAEWLYAAHRNWNTDMAWTAENSDYKLQPVCTKGAVEDLCDIVGNAMEWVNDWLGSFRDTTVTNYVGAPDGGKLGQRVVKGGCFRNNAPSITFHARGDVYTITSSTRSDYVGFRIAFGAIPDASWMGDNGKASSSRITPIANSSSIYPYTKTYRTKLVFRNDVTENLAYIDYSSGTQTVVEIEDTINSFHPDISPDGKRVAFCTRYEGLEGKSELYVRDLNEKGTNLVKLKVKSAAIPRWRVLDNGDTVIVYVTDAGNNKDSSAFKSKSTWQVPFANGKFGTPEKLFDGAYHGGISDDDRLAVTGASLFRSLVAESGSKSARRKLWYNGEQACNVSLSKDGSKRSLFLDFGGETGRKFVGSKYAAHQHLFVADSTGKLIHSVESPKGTTFDHTEWGQAPSDVAVATLTNPGGSHTEIVLVDLSKDGQIITLAKGDELWHPSLWSADVSSGMESDLLDLDSACHYMTGTSDVTTEIMKTKMDLFWQYRDTADLVVIGSSRSFAGVDPEYIRSYFAINMSYSAEDLTATQFFVENYILNLMPKLKVLVLTLDYDRWYVKDENWNLWFADLPGYEYDKNHGFWKDGVIGDMYTVSKNALSPSEHDYFIYTYHRGLYYSETEGWGGDIPDVAMDSLWYEHESSGMHHNLSTLGRILELCKQAGVKVVGVVYPQSPKFVNTGAWGRYGPSRAAVKIIEKAVDDLASKYPDFVVMDENKDGKHDYTYADFSNSDHLGLVGAQKLTRRLEKLLSSL